MKSRAYFFVFVFSVINLILCARAEIYENPEVDIYKVDLNYLNDFDVLEKNSKLDIVLLNDISTKEDKNYKPLNFIIDDGSESGLQASGYVTNLSEGKRLSQQAGLQVAANKLVLDNGQEVHFSATSPVFNAIHPPHVNSEALSIAMTITTLAIGSSSATLGIGLGVGFLVNGILSAYQNGIKDFVWGGLDGTGFSFIEHTLRKQPNVFLEAGNHIPFVLKEDLRINKGIQKEKIEFINKNKSEALTKIHEMLNRGDISGALEFALKTNQKEKYDEIVKKISM